MNKTYYELLGILPTAPKEVIVAAHIALHQKYNLDDGTAEEKAHAKAQLEAIDLAAQVLCNKASREEYDALLATGQTSFAPTKQHQKSGFGFWWLVALVFLLWLCYVLFSVGYDFYQLGTTSTVNQDTQVVVPPPKTLEQGIPVDIPIKDNKDQEERVLWEQKLKAKQQNFDEFWQGLDEQIQQMLVVDQEEWLNHAKADCQAMASAAAKVRLEELKCLSAKYDSRLEEVESFAKTVFLEQEADTSEAFDANFDGDVETQPPQ